jgi:hypothetical protein
MILLRRDVSDWHPRKIISTEALTEQKLKTLTTEMKWWLDILNEGGLPFGCEADDCCPTVTLYNHYVDFVRRSGLGRACTNTQLGIYLHRTFVPGLQRLEDQKYDYIAGGKQLTRKGYVYRFPSLADCRVAFDKLLGRPTEGDKPSAQIWQHPHADWFVIDGM